MPRDVPNRASMDLSVPCGQLVFEVPAGAGQRGMLQ